MRLKFRFFSVNAEYYEKDDYHVLNAFISVIKDSSFI